MPAPRGIFTQPKNTMPKIESLWLWLSVDPQDGNEGALAARLGDAWLPLFAADEQRLREMEQLARSIVHATGIQARLVKFTTREEVQELKP